MLAPATQSTPRRLFAAPRRVRSLGSSVSQAPTNSSISTRVRKNLVKNDRSREALLTRGASSPANSSLAKSEIESALRKAGAPMPIIAPM